MLILTTHLMQGYEVVAYQGLVTAKNVRAINLIRDFFTVFRDLVGGRSSSYQQVMDEIQSEVIAELSAQASALGANAILGFQLDFESIGSKNKSLLMAFAKGTAVVVRKTS